jgi:hypothetical protein
LMSAPRLSIQISFSTVQINRFKSCNQLNCGAPHMLAHISTRSSGAIGDITALRFG